MSEEKEKKLKQREKAFDYVFYIVLFFTVVVAIFYWFNFRGSSFSSKPEDWGVFGDYMGGTLNPLLAFFSFMLLLLNLKLQREQLDNAEEQLKLNREELAETRKIMDSQLITQKSQQFDSLYVLMINQLDAFFMRINGENVPNYINEFNGLKRLQGILKANQNFCRYKNYLLSVLEKVDSSGLSDEQKKIYVELLVSSIPENYLILLYLSLFDVDEIIDQSVVDRLEDFRFFQNITLIGNLNADLRFSLIYLMKFYGGDCFGGNKDFARIRGTWYYKKIIELEKYQSLSDWVLSVIQNYQYFQGVDKRLKIMFSSNGNALVYSENEKIGVIDLISTYFANEFIECHGGNIDMGLKYCMTIFEDHISLELDCFNEEQDIPEYLKEQKSLYGVPRL